jgi:hypothetical protein
VNRAIKGRALVLAGTFLAALGGGMIGYGQGLRHAGQRLDALMSETRAREASAIQALKEVEQFQTTAIKALEFAATIADPLAIVRSEGEQRARCFAIYSGTPMAHPSEDRAMTDNERGREAAMLCGAFPEARGL